MTRPPMRVLLTGTVTPQAQPLQQVLVDPAARRRQYIDSLRLWVPAVAAHGGTVVFYENSGEDLKALAVDAFGDVPENLLLHAAQQPPPEVVARGKSAGEAAMMDQFAADYGDGDPDELWVKCTGRLFVRNFDRCLPTDFTPRSIAARLKLDLSHMDTRFFAATPALWTRHLTGAGPLTNDSIPRFIEHVLATRLLAAVAEGATLLRLQSQPSWVGQSATFADRRYDSPRSRAKRIVMNGVESVLRGPLYGKHF